MAQTTTAINACDAVVQLTNSAGLWIDISGSSNEVSIDIANDVGDVTVFGGQWKNTLSCKSAATFALNAVYTTAASEAKDLLIDWQFTNTGIRILQVNIPDNSIGSDRYQSNVVLESLGIPATSGDAAPIIIAASMRNDGEVTAATVAT